MQKPDSAVYLLSSLLDQHPSSIEILPGDYDSLQQHSPDGDTPFSPFLFIDENLGIPKKDLYKTYIAALDIFATAKQTRIVDWERSTSAVRELLASSAVILMANPAHSTALNVRKHLNQRGHIDSERELQFTASLLSSRNCSNQSIIWHHRQWLLRRIYGPANSTLRLQSVDSTQPGLSDALTLPPEIIKAEILIASKACEIYPRNYFAWAHRCMCMHSAMLCIDIEPKYADPEVYIELVVCEVSNLRLWIEQHISDASAVHCLVVLITSLPCLTDAVKDAPQQPTSLAGNEKLHVANKLKECSLSVSHAISLVRSYPDHESLWMYLRAVSCLDGHRTVKENDDLEKFFRETAGPWASHTGRNRIGNSVTINAYRFLSLRALKASSPRQL